MFKILKLYGIPDKIITAIKVLYTEYIINHSYNQWRNNRGFYSAGILQGDTLASFLFIIIVDYVLCMSVDTISNKGFEIKPRQSSRHTAMWFLS